MKKARTSIHYIAVLQDEEMLEKQKQTLQEFNENDQIVHEIRYEEDAPVLELWNEYEGKNLKSAIEKDYLNETTVKKEFEYKGDTLVRIREYYNDEDYIDTLYEYNSNGKIVKENNLDNDDEQHGYADYIYDDTQQTVTENRYDEFNELIRVTTTVKNENGKDLEVMTENISDGVSTTTSSVYTYHVNGEILTIKKYEDGKLLQDVENTYDDQHKLSKQYVKDHKSKDEREIILTYDDKGNILTSEAYINGEHRYTDENTYNENGHLAENREYHFIDDAHTVCHVNLFEIEYL